MLSAGLQSLANDLQERSAKEHVQKDVAKKKAKPVPAGFVRSPETGIMYPEPKTAEAWKWLRENDAQVAKTQVKASIARARPKVIEVDFGKDTYQVTEQQFERIKKHAKIIDQPGGNPRIGSPIGSKQLTIPAPERDLQNKAVRSILAETAQGKKKVSALKERMAYANTRQGVLDEFNKAGDNVTRHFEEFYAPLRDNDPTGKLGIPVLDKGIAGHLVGLLSGMTKAPLEIAKEGRTWSTPDIEAKHLPGSIVNTWINAGAPGAGRIVAPIANKIASVFKRVPVEEIDRLVEGAVESDWWKRAEQQALEARGGREALEQAVEDAYKIADPDERRKALIAIAEGREYAPPAKPAKSKPKASKQGTDVPVAPGYRVETPQGPGTVRSVVGGITVQLENGAKVKVAPKDVKVVSTWRFGRGANMLVDNDTLIWLYDELRDRGVQGWLNVKNALESRGVFDQPTDVALFDDTFRSWSKTRGFDFMSGQTLKGVAGTPRDPQFSAEGGPGHLTIGDKHFDMSKPDQLRAWDKEVRSILDGKATTDAVFSNGGRAHANQEKPKANVPATSPSVGSQTPEAPGIVAKAHGFMGQLALSDPVARVFDLASNITKTVSSGAESVPGSLVSRGLAKVLNDPSLVQEHALSVKKWERVFKASSPQMRADMTKAWKGIEDASAEKFGVASGEANNAWWSLPGRLAGTGDVPFRTLHTANALDEVAGNVAQKIIGSRKGEAFENLRTEILGDLMNGRVPKGMTDVEAEGARSAATEWGLQMTYNSENRFNMAVKGLRDATGQGLSKTGKEVNDAVWNNIFRYSKVIGNVSLDAVNRTPAGLVEALWRGVAKLPKTAPGSAERIAESRLVSSLASKGLTGTALMTAGYYWFPDLLKIKIVQNAKGGSPYIETPEWADSLGGPLKPLLLGAQLRAIVEARQRGVITDSMARNLYMGTAQDQWNNPTFGGLKEMSGVFSGGSATAWGTAPGRQLSKNVPGFVRRLAKITDGNDFGEDDPLRRWIGSGNPVNTRKDVPGALLDELRKAIPGLRSGMEDKPIRTPYENQMGPF